MRRKRYTRRKRASIFASKLNPAKTLVRKIPVIEVPIKKRKEIRRSIRLHRKKKLPAKCINSLLLLSAKARLYNKFLLEYTIYRENPLNVLEVPSEVSHLLVLFDNKDSSTLPCFCLRVKTLTGVWISSDEKFVSLGHFFLPGVSAHIPLGLYSGVMLAHTPISPVLTDFFISSLSCRAGERVF